MTKEDSRRDMEMCAKCSACKFIPLEKVQGYEHVNVCPSITRYNFHAYSGGGRLATILAMLDNRFEYSDKLLDLIYNCQMCGACDVSCKYGMDMEVLEHLSEFRTRIIREGHTKPALEKAIDSLRKQNSMVPGVTQRRGAWAEGLNVKDFTQKPTEVIYHAGCRVAFDNRMWGGARATINLLQKAGIDVGIAGNHESCCGGRAYQIGFQEDLTRQAQCNLELFQRSGAKTLVTGCAECYHAFKVLYDQFGLPGGLEITHSTEFLDRLVQAGSLKPNRQINLTLTYHDPCHLGRLGEPYVHWEGKRVSGHMYRFDPPKPYRRGTQGVYEPPRSLLRSIPGLKLVEMDRTREYAWCCGAGGGVKKTNPEFAIWTAQERLAEAASTGAEVVATACPGCRGNFLDALQDQVSNLQVYDVIELVEKAIQ